MGAINAYQLLQRQGSIGGSRMDGPDVLESPNRQPKPEGDRYEAINRVKDDALAFVTGLFAATGVFMRLKIGNKWSRETIVNLLPEPLLMPVEGEENSRVVRVFGSLDELNSFLKDIRESKDHLGGYMVRRDHTIEETGQKLVMFGENDAYDAAIAYIFDPSGKKLDSIEIYGGYGKGRYYYVLNVPTNRLIFTDIGSFGISYEAINDKWQELDISFYMTGSDPDRRSQIRNRILNGSEYLKKSPAEKVKFLEKMIGRIRTSMAADQFTSSPARSSMRLKTLMFFCEMLAELHVEQNNPVAAAEAYVKAAYLAIRSGFSQAVKYSFVKKIQALNNSLPVDAWQEHGELMNQIGEFYIRDAYMPAVEIAQKEITMMSGMAGFGVLGPKELARDLLRMRNYYHMAYFNYEITNDTAFEALERFNRVIQHSLAAAYAKGELTAEDLTFFRRAAEKTWLVELALAKDPKYLASETEKQRKKWIATGEPEDALGLDKKELLTEKGRAAALLRFEADYGPASLKGMLKDIIKKAGR